MLISVFSQVELELVSFLILCYLGLCVFRYLIAIWEKDSISLWILELGT